MATDRPSPRLWPGRPTQTSLRARLRLGRLTTDISVPRLAGLKESSRSRVKNPLIWSYASERSVDPAIGEG